MTQQDIDEAVASVTGESVALIHERGFGIADALEANYDPELRGPLVFDWDTMAAAEWAM